MKARLRDRAASYPLDSRDAFARSDSSLWDSGSEVWCTASSEEEPVEYECEGEGEALGGIGRVPRESRTVEGRRGEPWVFRLPWRKTVR